MNTQQKRTIAILRALFLCRDDITQTMDKRTDWAAIKGIGKKRAPIAAALMRLSVEDWERVTGMPVHFDEV